MCSLTIVYYPIPSILLTPIILPHQLHRRSAPEKEEEDEEQAKSKNDLKHESSLRIKFQAKFAYCRLGRS